MIRPIALAIIRHNGRLLVFRGEDPMKPEVFYRPLGGGIDFGETAQAAVKREIREEIGAELTDVRYIGTLENIFTLRGKAHHEIVLLFEATLSDRTLYDVQALDGREADGSPLPVTWKPLSDFEAGEVLYPDGLLQQLRDVDSTRDQ